MNCYQLEIPNGKPLGTTATTAATFDLIAVGSYTFRVTDTDTGCYVDTPPYKLHLLISLTLAATAITPVTCFGDTNGELEINITGYTGTYDYQIFDAAGNPIGGVVNTDTSVNPRRYWRSFRWQLLCFNYRNGYSFLFRRHQYGNHISPDMPLQYGRSIGRANLYQ